MVNEFYIVMNSQKVATLSSVLPSYVAVIHASTVSPSFRIWVTCLLKLHNYVVVSRIVCFWLSVCPLSLLSIPCVDVFIFWDLRVCLCVCVPVLGSICVSVISPYIFRLSVHPPVSYCAPLRLLCLLLFSCVSLCVLWHPESHCVFFDLLIPPCVCFHILVPLCASLLDHVLLLTPCVSSYVYVSLIALIVSSWVLL